MSSRPSGVSDPCSRTGTYSSSDSRRLAMMRINNLATVQPGYSLSGLGGAVRARAALPDLLPANVFEVWFNPT